MKPYPLRATRIVIAALLALAVSQTALAESYLVDFNAYPLYIKAGWDATKAKLVPDAGDGTWKVLPPASGAGGRSARPSDLGLPGMPLRPPFSLTVYPELDFSYVIPFELDAATAARLGADYSSRGTEGGAPAVPGLNFAGLGDNWEIFVNGVLVRSEMHRDAEGAILEHRILKDLHFPFEGSLLKTGTNVLAVHIVADPTYPPEGFHEAEPYYLDVFENIARRDSELWPVTLCGLYFFVGFYHLFMFLVRRRDLHNLFYGLFSIDLAIYLFVRTHTASLVVENSATLFRIEYFTLFLILPLVGAFLETLHHDRVGRLTLGYGLLCGLLSIVQALTPLSFAHDLLRGWQFSGLAMACYYFGWGILGRFLVDGWRRWQRQRQAEGARRLPRVYFSALGRTPQGNLLIGGFILFVTAVFDIIDSIYLNLNLVLTQYGFFVFTMGTALVLANRLGFLHDRLSGLNGDLEERLRVLTETGARLTASERRYRSLFEGSSDPVALLDEELRFIEANAAARELFGLDRPGRAKLRLGDALYVEEREGGLPLEILRQSVTNLSDKNRVREVSLRLRNAIGEAIPSRLRLERIDILERREILLRVSPEKRDSLLDSLVEGHERFEIESSLTTADEVCKRATAGLERYLKAEDAGFVAICLREAVVNAVEHGSLEIKFDEKSESQREGRYFEFLQKRRLDPRFRHRRVSVEYSVSTLRATYRVTDEGPGFDYKKWAGSGEPHPSLLEHGRGLYMARSAFDKVVFNEKGNQITMVKWFSREGSARE